MQSYVISIPKGTLFCNATGSSQDTRKSNWIKYWKDYSGHRGSYDIKCCSAGCGNQAKYGGPEDARPARTVARIARRGRFTHTQAITPP